MPGPELPTAAVRSALRLAGLLVVVAGLFGMHGLTGHGLHGPHDAQAGSAHEAMVMAAPVAWLDASDGGPARTRMGVGTDTGTVTTCVAVLGAALLTLLRRPQRELCFALTRTRPDPTRAVGHPGQALAPPSLTHLSVRRC